MYLVIEFHLGTNPTAAIKSRIRRAVTYATLKATFLKKKNFKLQTHQKIKTSIISTNQAETMNQTISERIVYIQVIIVQQT